jgi:23S rRNA pseudouridine2605 synthase
LIIVTNDGEFANRLMHPSANIQREYLAKTLSDITHEHLVAISEGTMVEDVWVKPIRVKKVRKGTVKVVVGEGRKREVRLLLKAAGLEVRELTRIRIGGLLLGKLPLGACRILTEREREALLQ